jgi:hypothetical protein
MATQLTIPLPVVKDVSGLILYKGPSLINEKSIVAIATGLKGGSHNVKTGAMVQVWILAADQNPIKTYETGADEAICGDCKHGKMGTCYVNLGQGPYAVYGAYQRDKYTEATDDLIKTHFAGRTVRFGAYGDPAAIPLYVWEKILSVSERHTAYTHQWKKDRVQPYKSFCMASVDNEKEYAEARKLGWRTFRVRLESEPVLEREFICPASHEANKRLTCQQCCACNGGDKLGTVTIITHGTSYKPKRFIAVRKLQDQKKGWKHLIPLKILNRQAS